MRSSKFFTCTPTYRSQLEKLPLDIETRKPEAVERLPDWSPDEDGELTSPVHPDLRFHRLGHTLSEGALYQLPDPDQVTEARKERFVIEVVPVDVTGKGFQRLIKFRRSLVHFDYVKRRRKRRDKNRRNTIGDTSDIQRAVRAEQASTSGAGRAVGTAAAEALDQETQTEAETSRLDSSTADEDHEASFTTHTIRAEIELAEMAAAADASASVGRLPKLGAANTFDPPVREPVYELIRRAKLPLGGALPALRQRGILSEASSSGHGSGASNRTSADSERVVSPADSGTVTSPLEDVAGSPRRRPGQTSPVDSGLSDGDRRLEEASFASDDTITPDLPDDGDNSSAFSCDTEGYYTSFHCDSGLRSGHESEYDLVGRGSTGTGTASNTSGSDNTVIMRKKPPPPPRCSSLEAGNRESVVTVIHVDAPSTEGDESPVGPATSECEQDVAQAQEDLISKIEPAAPSEDRSEDSAIVEDRSRSEEREHSLSPARSDTRSESDFDLPERQLDFHRITAMTSGRIPSLCVITPPPPSSDGDETDWMPPSPVRYMQIVSGRGPAGATVHVQPPPPPPPLAPPPDTGEWSIVDDSDLANWVNADDEENNNSGEKDTQILTERNMYNIVQKSTRDREYLLWADIPVPDEYRVKDAIEDVYGNVEDVKIRRQASNVVSPHVFRLTVSPRDDNRRGLGIKGELEYVTIDDIPKPNAYLVPFALLTNNETSSEVNARRHAGARVTLNPAGEVIYSSGSQARELSHTTFEPGECVTLRGDRSVYTRSVLTPRPARHQPPSAATSASVLLAVQNAGERPPLPLPDDAVRGDDRSLDDSTRVQEHTANTPRHEPDSFSHHDVSMGSLSGSDTVSQGSLTDASSVDTLSGVQEGKLGAWANLREWGPVSGGACEAPATPPGSVPELSLSDPSLDGSPPDKTSTLKNGSALMAALEKSRRLLGRAVSDGDGLHRLSTDETVPGLDASGSHEVLAQSGPSPQSGSLGSPTDSVSFDMHGHSFEGGESMADMCLVGGEAMMDVSIGVEGDLSGVSDTLSAAALSTDSELSPVRSSRRSESSDGESSGVRPVPGVVKIDYSQGMVRFPEKKPMYVPDRRSSDGSSPAPSIASSRRSGRSGSGTPESPASVCTVVSAPARGGNPSAILSGFRSLRKGQTASLGSNALHYLATLRRKPSSSASSASGSATGAVSDDGMLRSESKRRLRETAAKLVASRTGEVAGAKSSIGVSEDFVKMPASFAGANTVATDQVLPPVAVTKETLASSHPSHQKSNSNELAATVNQASPCDTNAMLPIQSGSGSSEAVAAPADVSEANAEVNTNRRMVRSRSMTPPGGSRRRRAESPSAGGAVCRLLDSDAGRGVVPLILPAASGAPTERTRRGAYVNLQQGRRSLESGGGCAPTATVAPQRRSLDVPSALPKRETPSETHVVSGKPLETDFFESPSSPDKPVGFGESCLDDSRNDSLQPADVSKDSIQSTESARSGATVRRNNSYKMSVGEITAVAVDIDDKPAARPSTETSNEAQISMPTVEVGSTVAIRPGGLRNIEPVRVAKIRRTRGSKLFIDPSIFKQSAKDPRVDVPKSLQISKRKDDTDTEIW